MAAGLGALSVLVVDDNTQMRAIIGKVLIAAGVGDLHYASDGEQALQMLELFPIDLAYVDHEMPKMRGAQLVKAIRARAGYEFLPLIMLTGHSDLRRLSDARDAGINEFLCKPVTATDILRRLEAVIMRPRQYISSRDFFGPDRRRRRDADYGGRMRRSSDAEAAVQI